MQRRAGALRGGGGRRPDHRAHAAERRRPLPRPPAPRRRRRASTRRGRVWASLLTGPPGFVQPVDPQLLRLAAQPAPGDPLADNLEARPELGLLVLDPTTRQRMRFNGRGMRRPEGLFLLVDQAYGNCPKYIQLRQPERDGGARGPTAVRGSRRRSTSGSGGDRARGHVLHRQLPSARAGPTPRTGAAAPASCASSPRTASPSTTIPATACSTRSATSSATRRRACCSSTSRRATSSSSPAGRASSPTSRSSSRSTRSARRAGRARCAIASSSRRRRTRRCHGTTAAGISSAEPDDGPAMTRRT